LLPERHSLSWLRSCAVSRAPSSSSLYLPFRTSSVGFAANIRGIIFIIQGIYAKSYPRRDERIPSVSRRADFHLFATSPQQRVKVRPSFLRRLRLHRRAACNFRWSGLRTGVLKHPVIDTFVVNVVRGNALPYRQFFLERPVKR
jgi:hypothetical protein